MAVRPPSDAVVALRSLDRRFRALFTGLDEDERADDVALRPSADGISALDHVVAATRSITANGRALERTLLEEDPRLDPPAGGPVAPAPGAAAGTVDERVSELAWEADALADRADSVAPSEWGRTAVALGREESVTAAELLWAAVDAAVAHLKAAERTLAEVRRPR